MTLQKKRWQWLKFEMIYIYVGHRNTFNKWKQAMHIEQWTNLLKNSIQRLVKLNNRYMYYAACFFSEISYLS